MAKAIQKNALVSYVAEVTPGVTPVTPAFKRFRANGETLEVARKFAFTNELDGFRGVKAHALASKSGSGGFDFELHYASLDEILEGLARSAWSTNVLTDGTTRKTFTLETKFETGATDVYKRLTGAEVDSLSLSIKAQEIATGKVAFTSMDSDFANAAVAGATYTAADTNPVLVGADFGSLAMSGLTIGCMPSLEIMFKNNLDPIYCLGSLAATDMITSKLDVEFNFSLHLADDEYDVLRAGADGTDTSLTFEIGRSAGSKYRFELPFVVLSDIKVVAESADGGSVLIQGKGTAKQAASLGNSVFRITRAV